MISRLDRLFTLLDTGSTESIRLAAAEQLGQVQKARPQDLHFLLTKIKVFVYKSSWETRVAAGHATRCILEQVEPWSTTASIEGDHDKLPDSIQQQIEILLRLQGDVRAILSNFSIKSVIESKFELASSDVAINDIQDKPSTSKSNRKTKPSKALCEQLSKQRKLINKELGIDIVDKLNLGLKSTDIVSNDDLQTNSESDNSQESLFKTSSLRVTSSKDIFEQTIYYHEILKEKLLDLQRQLCQHKNTNALLEWPLHEVARSYILDLFNPCWEARHGASIALREIVRIHGKDGGKIAGFDIETNNILNQQWLVALSLCSLSVLALDKFGDFLFDQVVAPVRENSAQLLSSCLIHLSTDFIEDVINISTHLLDHSAWETRHGGILALKYALNSIPRHLAKNFLKNNCESIVKCLSDMVDDVSAEAAATLISIKDLIVETIPERIPELTKLLWSQLKQIDELNSSTSNLVLLLTSLLTSTQITLEVDEISSYIESLLPKIGHPSTTVRISILESILTLMKLVQTNCVSWMETQLLDQSLRLVYQRCLTENDDIVHSKLENIWIHLTTVSNDDIELCLQQKFNLLQVTSQYLNFWICLLMHPSTTPINMASPLWCQVGYQTENIGNLYLASCNFNIESVNEQRQKVTKCRLLASSFLGSLYAVLVDQHEHSKYCQETLTYISDMFVHYLKTTSANQKLVSSWTLEAWANTYGRLVKERKISLLPKHLIDQLDTAIKETSLYYDELINTFTCLQKEAREYVSLLDSYNIPFPSDSKRSDIKQSDKKPIYTLQEIQIMLKIDFQDELEQLSSKKSNSTSREKITNSSKEKILSKLNNQKANLSKSYKEANESHISLSTCVLSSIACANIAWCLHPEKINLLIKPLISSIEIETDILLQQRSVSAFVKLIETITADNLPYELEINSSLTRLIDNTFLLDNNDLKIDSDSDRDKLRIIYLDNISGKRDISYLARRKSNYTNLKRSYSCLSIDAKQESDVDKINNCDTFEQKNIKLRGVVTTMKRLVSTIGSDLPKKLPKLWYFMNIAKTYSSQTAIQDIMSGLRIFDFVWPDLDKELQSQLQSELPSLIDLLSSEHSVIRHYSARCIGTICCGTFEDTHKIIKQKVLPLLENLDQPFQKCGSIECIASIIESLHLDLVPYCHTFIVPILRRMSDPIEQVRMMAAHCFGQLLSLLPLTRRDVAVKLEGDPDNVSEENFVLELLNPKLRKPVDIPKEINAQLRHYQQDGVNWLSFLNRFSLHGILCDEMGLGKTLMMICVIVSDYLKLKTEYLKSPNAKFPLPTLIVCPSTLTEHWYQEINKFLSSQSLLNCIIYSGSIHERELLRKDISRHLDERKKDFAHCDIINTVITSYELVRSDIEYLKQINWNYCVLDEGHIIKNGKTKLSKAVKQINADHRVILSGTPIQNNVTELWSLFDFLMPGFLGTEYQFNNNYTKPILQSRETKCSSKESEYGVLALESLHRQVLPFILRRCKSDVLNDLPPKIIQDYICELSPLQLSLYEDFTKSSVCKSVSSQSNKEILEADSKEKKGQVFQALKYLKNVCNHPKLVMNNKNPILFEKLKNTSNYELDLDDIENSAKLSALKQLLLDCGMGEQVSDQNSEFIDTLNQGPVIKQHRALIFCQLRSMIDIIEKDLLDKHLPSVTYLRLDGSVPSNQRQSIVNRFNEDPSIDLMLLTTQVGGLGLNLTGADTVIFFEHDWNPTRDLQAMDRAHRIGQKKIVNVYRMITKNTIEEKIMSLQKFKMMVSDTVISKENSNFGTMQVDNLFDLFDTKNMPSKSVDNDKTKEKSAFPDILPELWNEQQYETEYDLSSFIATLRKN